MSPENDQLRKRVISTLANPFQRRFLASSADITIGGGAGGAGKSYALLLAPLRHIHIQGFTALFLRRQTKDQHQAGGLWHTATQLYPLFGGVANQHRMTWTFQSGAEISFNHLDKNTYQEDYQGAQICLLCFDEVTHFAEEEFQYMLSRNRPPDGITFDCYTMATCNPDPDSWLARMLKPWLGPHLGDETPTAGEQCCPRADMAGVTMSGVYENDRWIIERDDRTLLQCVPELDPDDILRVKFVPGTIEDNDFISRKYKAFMRNQTADVKERIRGGCWGGKARRSKFWEGRTVRGPGCLRGAPDGLIRLVQAAPGVQWLRIWDLAATGEQDSKKVSKSSWTCGLKLGWGGRRLWLGHLEHGRWTGPDAMERVKAAAARDGRGCKILICQERAGAGKALVQLYTADLLGYTVLGVKEEGADKTARLEPFRTQALAGNVLAVDGPHVEQLLDLLELLGKHAAEDLGDCLSQGVAHFGDPKAGPSGEQVRRSTQAFGALAEELEGRFERETVGWGGNEGVGSFEPAW